MEVLPIIKLDHTEFGKRKSKCSVGEGVPLHIFYDEKGCSKEKKSSIECFKIGSQFSFLLFVWPCTSLAKTKFVR